MGRQLTTQVIEEASDAAAEDAQPMPDPLRGSAEYKKEMAKVYTKRGLDLAVKRAKRGK
jgi:CO/xanthine dehydrogenase FAD-binding subunit